MGFNRVDEHIAKVKLQLNNSNGWIAHFATIWRGKPLLVSYNNLHCCLNSINYTDFLEERDIDFIKFLIEEYLKIQDE